MADDIEPEKPKDGPVSARKQREDNGDKKRRRPDEDIEEYDDDEDDDDDDRPVRRRRRNYDDDDRDATGGLIPYKNSKALTSYYLGVFSLIPCIGVILAIVAIILGFGGLKYHKLHPRSGGTAHAYVGIILGTLVILGHITLVALGFGAAIFK